MTMKTTTEHRLARLLLACAAAIGAGPGLGRPSRRLFGPDLGRRHAVRPGRRRCLCLDQQERRRQRHQDQCRHRRLRLSGAARDRPVQEVVGPRQGRRDPGLGHRRHRSADRLRRQGQDPLYFGSYAAALTDPTGASGKAKPAPYNFFYGPSYSDAVRAHADLGGRGLEGQGQVRQAEIRPHGRQPPLSERAEGSRRGDCRRNSASTCCRRSSSP